MDEMERAESGRIEPVHPGAGHPEHVQEGADEATESERLAGLLEQIRADVAQGAVHDPVGELRLRLTEEGRPAEGPAFEALAAQLTSE